MAKINDIHKDTRNKYKCTNKTDGRESPKEAQPARENSSLGVIEAVHHE